MIQTTQHHRTASPRRSLLKTQKTSLSPSACMSPISPSGSGTQTSGKCLVSYSVQCLVLSRVGIVLYMKSGALGPHSSAL
uniref:Uncharacterized protein n=1 Tax=Spermophilus dauricus TaxID=99837 RepID=A0A8C9NZS6_SPEDA